MINIIFWQTLLQIQGSVTPSRAELGVLSANRSMHIDHDTLAIEQLIKLDIETN